MYLYYWHYYSVSYHNFEGWIGWVVVENRETIISRVYLYSKKQSLVFLAIGQQLVHPLDHLLYAN